MNDNEIGLGWCEPAVNSSNVSGTGCWVGGRMKIGGVIRFSL